MSTTPASPRRPRWRSLLLLALLLAPLLWPVHYLAERYYREVLIEQNRQTLDLYVANLLGTLRRYEVLPQILGDLPGLRAALHAPDDPAVLDSANRLLTRVREQTGADVIYLMTPRGVTLAAEVEREVQEAAARRLVHVDVRLSLQRVGQRRQEA